MLHSSKHSTQQQQKQQHLQPNNQQPNQRPERLPKSCLKPQRPSDNVANFYQPERHAHLYRWPSQPSLRRRWTCHRCGLENVSVTWHCLNCESVSLLAPIYKGTLAREQSFESAIVGGKETRETATKDVRETKETKEATRDGTKANAMHTPSQQHDDQQQQGFKCYLCMYRTKPAAQLLAGGTNVAAVGDEAPRCRHHHHMRMRAKHLRFPLTSPDLYGQQQQPPQQQQQLQQQQYSNLQTTGRQQSYGQQPPPQQQPSRSQQYGRQQQHPQHQQHQQKSFDDARPYGADSAAVVVQHEGLYYSNRRINKSLSSITDYVDAFGGGVGFAPHLPHNYGGNHIQPGGGEFYDTVFGERIGGGGAVRPKGFAATVIEQRTLRRSLSKGSDGGAAYAFDQWSAGPAVASPSPTSSVATAASSMVDYGRTKSPAADSIASGDRGGTGHFTITTLSRSSGDSSSRSTTASKRSLPRNGGVFVSVGSWTAQPLMAALVQQQQQHRSSPPHQIVSSSAVMVPPMLSPANSGQDTLGYEILKNPYAGGNGHLYENQPLKMQQPLQPIRLQQPTPPQNVEPVYAVVNKMNKTRNREPTATRAFDSLYASIRNGGGGGGGGGGRAATDGMPTARSDDRIDGCAPSRCSKASDSTPDASTAAAAAADVDAGGSSFIEISSGVQEPGSDTSDIYAKVWKGPRKPLDTQRK